MPLIRAFHRLALDLSFSVQSILRSYDHWECAQGFVPGAPGGVDPFLMNMAGNVLQQSGSNYLQKGQAFMQSKMGFMSGGLLHYHFSVTADYGECVLILSAC